MLGVAGSSTAKLLCGVDIRQTRPITVPLLRMRALVMTIALRGQTFSCLSERVRITMLQDQVVCDNEPTAEDVDEVNMRNNSNHI